ncbi:hypothetical protein B1J92_K07898g [Nakaseomyces glabratus]|nr:hypothetical protein B1J91_K07898g [Nakaseomyces glabratus]OXB46943.1 hypothetical protein B1J92_K07898g [Nakaseomyces glabratus]
MSEQRPIRVAVLGGDSTGKTSFVSRLTLNIVHEVHYPTRDQTNWLFDFIPHSPVSRAILDAEAHERLAFRTPGSQVLEPIFSSPSVTDHVLLSPLVFQAFTDEFTQVRNQNKGRTLSYIRPMESSKKKKPHLYKYSNNNGKAAEANDKGIYLRGPTFMEKSPNNELPVNYVPPVYSPILIDIIDTPGFKPDMVVPFLEVSLFANLDKNILRGLADEPRQPVSTTSLLVASGASELNGKIDGYVFVYSAIPELSHLISPPSYEFSNTNKDVANLSIDKTKTNESIPWSSYTKKKDGGFSLLDVIRDCILDAWAEFRDYQRRWEMGQEDDVYSLFYTLKHMWKAEKDRSTKIQELRSYKTTLNSIETDPSSPDSPPPCLIVCTHTKDNMASPLLIEKGRQLATQWKCGFVALDNLEDYNVDVALSLLIREIAEKEKLQIGRGNKMHQSIGKDHSLHPSKSNPNNTESSSSGAVSMFKKFLRN